MASSTLSVQVSDRLAATLAPFDGLLSVDRYIAEQMLRDQINETGRRIAEIAEDGADPKTDELREAACRLDQIATALDEMNPIRTAVA
jgi:hypothetical protein